MVTEFLIAGAGVYTYRKLEYRIKNRNYIRECKELNNLFLTNDKLYPVVDADIEEEYGMRFIVSLSENSYSDLEKLQERLEVNYGCQIEIERNDNMKTATIYVLQLKLDDNNARYKPYKCNSHELFLALDNKFKPMTVDMYESPHVMVTGSTGSGKSEEIKLITTNLIHFNNEKQVNIHICNVGNTEDFYDFQNCKQVKSMVTNMKDIVKQFTYILDLYNSRMSIFKTNNVKNIKQYNYKFKNSNKKMADVFLITDEIANLFPSNANVSYYNEKQQSYNMLLDIARLVRKTGLFIIVGIQRASIDIFDPSLKTNMCTILGFNQNNTASSLVAVDTTELAHIGKRNFLGIYDCDRKWARSLYITDDMIKEYVKDSVVPNRQAMSDFNVFLKDKSKIEIESDETKGKKSKPIKSVKKSKVINMNQEVASGKVSRVKNIEQISNIDYTVQDGRICLKLREKVE